MSKFEHYNEPLSLVDGIKRDLEKDGMIPVVVFMINKEGQSKFRFQGNILNDPQFRFWMINTMESYLAKMKEGFLDLGKVQ